MSLNVHHHLTRDRMRLSRYVALVGLTGLAGACVLRPGMLDSSLPRGNQWTAILTPTNGGTVRGSVIFVRTSPETWTRAIFNLTDGTGGAVHPWHIHYGVCGDDHRIVSNPSKYPPLILGSTGSLSASAQLPVRLLDDEKYVVHIHASAMDMRTIACGPLVPDRAIASAGR